jgi:hypothetical protein
MAFDPKSVTSVNMTNGQLAISKDVKGVFSDSGQIIATGAVYVPVIWKQQQLKPFLSTKVGSFLDDYSIKFHWVDILAFTMALATVGPDRFTGRPVHKVGLRVLDELSLLMIGEEIVQGEGSKSWNSIMDQKNILDPIALDDTVQSDSPFNPDSPYYNPKKDVFTYDPENGYIIYKSGEILWTKTGGVYFDQTDGGTLSYDKVQQVVTFAKGAFLNLKTLRKTLPSGESIAVSNQLPWFQKLFKNLLSDTKTQMIFLGSLILLLFVKSKRNK